MLEVHAERQGVRDMVHETSDGAGHTHKEILVRLTDDWNHPYWREIKEKDQMIIRRREVTKLVLSCEFTFDCEGSPDMPSITTHIRDWTPEL